MKLQQLMNKNSYLLRMLASFLILTAIITLVLSFVLYFRFQTIGMELVNRSILDKLSQTSYSASYLRSSASAASMQVYFDREVIMAMNGDTLSDQEISSLVNKLEQVVTSSNFIHSLSVYNANQDLLISTRDFTNGREKEFLKSYIDSMVRTRDGKRDLHPIPRNYLDSREDLGSPKYTPVYTYVLFDYYPDTGKPLNALILNVKEEWIRNIMSSINSNELDNTFIIDGRGTIVSHTATDRFLTDLSGEGYVDKVLKSKSPSGSFTDTINGRTSVVTYVSSDKLGWRFINLLPYHTVTEKITPVRDYTLMISFFILFMGLLLSFLLSRSIYTPIKTLTKNLVDTSVYGEDSTMNELQLIQSAFEKTVSRANSLETFKREQAGLVREEFLRKFLYNNDLSITNETTRSFSELNIRLSTTAPLKILLLRLDHYSMFSSQYSRKDQQLYLFAIKNIAGELLESTFTNEVIETRDDMIAAFLCMEGKTEEEALSILVPIIKQIQQACLQHLQLSLTAAVGSTCRNIQDTCLSFHEAIRVSEYRLKYGHTSILTGVVLEEQEHGDFIYPVKKESLLQDALKLGKKNQAEQCYTDIVNHAMDYSVNDVNATITRLALAVSIAAATIGRFNEIDFSLSIDAILKRISQLETIDQINVLFREMFDRIIGYVEEKKSNKSVDLVSKMMEKINRSYSDKNISVDSLADEEKMSSVYMGRVFREMTNQSVAEYINEVRLKKAQELLMETSIPIGDIADKVGFITVPHFYRIFKKACGITPNEYRKKSGNTTD